MTELIFLRKPTLFSFRIIRLKLCLSASVFLLLCNTAFANQDVPSSLQAPSQASKFLSVDKAFPFNSYQNGDQLYLNWQIQDGYYLYQDKISIKTHGVTSVSPILPSAEPHNDEFFGDVQIYKHALSVILPLTNIERNASIAVTFQGCSRGGLCYPPETKVISVDPVTTETTAPTTSQDLQFQDSNIVKNDNSLNPTYFDQLGTRWWAPVIFIAFGFGMALTPCVLPMYPIVSSIVLGQERPSMSRTFGLSLLYVQGMALTYTLLGLLVASAGIQFQASLQQPWVLILISALFVALAASMFGLFTLQMPNVIQTKLNSLSNDQQGGRYWGVFVMGAISGLVCSPCTTAPLSGVLLYVAQSGDQLTGAISLYALSIGMGIPLIIASLFGQRLLPKAGAWMNNIKTFFGFVLLSAPIFLLERVFSSQIIAILWCALGLVYCTWGYHALRIQHNISWINSTLRVMVIVGLITSTQGIWYAWQYQATDRVNHEHLNFKKVTSLIDLNHALSEAKQNRKNVMLDFYADWCTACKEFEKYTFNQPRIQQRLKNSVLLQINVTENTPEALKVLHRLNVLGLPSIDFWNQEGKYLQNHRVTGFMNATDFNRHLDISSF